MIGAMPPAARLLHLGTTSLQARHYSDSGTEHDQISVFAILAIQEMGEQYSDAHQFVRVYFRQTPGGRIEDGDLTIDKVELAVWDDTKRPVDEGGKIVDMAVLVQALSRDIPATMAAEARAIQEVIARARRGPSDEQK
jgi:hypothetical protein